MAANRTLGIQLVVPMAGKGSRFADAGYELPKPLLSVHGQPMYRIVLGNLVTDNIVSVTLVAQRAHLLAREMSLMEARLERPVNLIEIDHVTQGPAESVHLAMGVLDPGLPVVTANSDQYVDFPIHRFYDALREEDLGGAVLTMEDHDPKWSYAAVDEFNNITDVREKIVISKHATVGIYAFQSASLLASAIESMFTANDRTNGEFYLAPVYNYLVSAHWRIRAVPTGPVSTVMHGLGTPEDYESFLRRDIARVASERAAELIGND